MPIGPNEIFSGAVLAALGVSVVSRLIKGKNLGIFGAGRSGEADAGTLTAPEGGEIPAGVWIRYVSDNPQVSPHLLLAGPSGSGKTTLATSLLAARPGQVLIITGKTGDAWGGLPSVEIDDDGSYRTAEATFKALDAEVKRRLVASKRGALTSQWLTVCLDDYAELRSECPAADSPFRTIARLGRSLRVRLIVLSDSDQVKSLGLEGEGAMRGNFVVLRLRRGHAGTIQPERTDAPIAIAIPHHQVKLDADRAWRSDDAELARLFGLDSVAAGGAENEEIAPLRYATLRYATTTTNGVPMRDSGTTPPDDDEAAMIRGLLAAGHSRNQVAKLLGGSMTTAYKRIHRATGERDEEN